EDGIRYKLVTGVQTCALPILADREQEVGDDLATARRVGHFGMEMHAEDRPVAMPHRGDRNRAAARAHDVARRRLIHVIAMTHPEIGRASCRERGSMMGGTGAL